MYFVEGAAAAAKQQWRGSGGLVGGLVPDFHGHEETQFAFNM